MPSSIFLQSKPDAFILTVCLASGRGARNVDIRLGGLRLADDGRVAETGPDGHGGIPLTDRWRWSLMVVVLMEGPHGAGVGALEATWSWGRVALAGVGDTTITKYGERCIHTY